MSGIWIDGQFSWRFIAAIVFIVLVLLTSDYAWRVSRLGGKLVGSVAAGTAMIGLLMIFVFLS
jgi:hypothetical protein